MEDIDKEFYARADAHIRLSNSQVSESIGKGRVSASTMYATARFNAFVSACGWETKEEMVEARQEILEYFVAEYRKMLEENVDDHIQNFDAYMKTDK